jgi:magnesium-transporting ATPase (P-type)
MMNLFTV